MAREVMVNTVVYVVLAPNTMIEANLALSPGLYQLLYHSKCSLQILWHNVHVWLHVVVCIGR